MDLRAHSSQDRYIQAATYVREHTDYHPTTAVILGSGLRSLADSVAAEDVIAYTSIPYFPTPTVQGHSGRLIVGNLEGRPVLVMQGRAHFYEGYTMDQVTFPVRMMRFLGIDTLIVTNAAGGLVPSWAPGDLMLITDHINLLGMAGLNPLIGPNDPQLGPRFPDMSQAYDPHLRASAREIAVAEGIPLREGVYVCLAGPTFETPAEIRFLRTIGANAVGMSTVPEVTVARHMSMRVLGISGITNVHDADAPHPRETTHEEVLETGRMIAPRMAKLIRGILNRL
jgi:purine-nucleoside phosphorylase